MPMILESNSGNGWRVRQRCPELNATLGHKPEKLADAFEDIIANWLKSEPSTLFRVVEVDELLPPIDLDKAYEHINKVAPKR